MNLESPSFGLPFAAVIVAAGQGLRLGGELPKQYQALAGKIMLRHSADTFAAYAGLQHLCVVIHPDHRVLAEQALAGISVPVSYVHGGETRQDSVRNALQSLQLNADLPVLVHDAARPCLAAKDLNALLKAVHADGAATLACPVVDTLRKDGVILDRTDVWAMQTPQAAKLEWMLKAHEQGKAESYTDDTAVLTAAGYNVTFVPGARENMKVTTADDMQMAELILNARSRRVLRIGNGFDVHAFGDAGTGPLRIGGIDVPHEKKLAGHSDADVVLHAITDALYGALADGDIGSHFPPSDNQWKGKDSAFFLEQAMVDIRKQSGDVMHVDVTIMCEMPKIGPHRDAMRERIASIMSLPLRNIAVKATTTEKLGFTGRGEGIATQAVVTVEFVE